MGLRGYGADGLPDLAFRGARVARNMVHADTGLRLEEQSSLSLFELPQRDGFHGYYRSWLPGSTAKYESARNIYFPETVLRNLWTYTTRPDLLQRKLSEGKPPAEARRALKRRLANVVYRQILKDQQRALHIIT